MHFFLFSQVSTFVLVHLCNTSAPFHVIGETCSHAYADLELLDISCSFSFSAVVHIFTCALLQYVCSSAIFHIIEGTCSHVYICRFVYILNGILNHSMRLGFCPPFRLESICNILHYFLIETFTKGITAHIS